MPIRFVCSNCHQRLSVRPEKAGQQVKCPKCRQIVLVPVQPPEVADAERESGNLGEPPLPADSLSSFAVYDRDDELVYVPEPAASGGQVPADTVAVPRRVLFLQGFLLGLVALVFFVFGVIVGSRSEDPANGMVVRKPCVITGSVTFEDKEGRLLADEGSAVFLVPANVRPDQKVLIDGLRIADPPPAPGDRCVTAVRDLGGDLTRSGSQGAFRIRVPVSGEYYLLIVSRNARRPNGNQPKPQHLAEMGRYFLPAAELLDDRRYEWRKVLIDADREIDMAF